MLSAKKIVLGICGGIAAYKSAYIIRLLIKENAEVKVIATSAAFDFITPLTLSTLSGNPVYHHAFDRESGVWNSHVKLAEWADLFLIAPATANTIAKMATGLADNLLLTTYLSTTCPVVLAPAMDLHMYKHAATQLNLNLLSERGHHIIPVGDGELASGLCGEGRMAEPEDIVRFIDRIIT